MPTGAGPIATQQWQMPRCQWAEFYGRIQGRYQQGRGMRQCPHAWQRPAHVSSCGCVANAHHRRACSRPAGGGAGAARWRALGAALRGSQLQAAHATLCHMNSHYCDLAVISIQSLRLTRHAGPAGRLRWWSTLTHHAAGTGLCPAFTCCPALPFGYPRTQKHGQFGHGA